jgi:phosphoglucosamine mutase
LGWTLGGETSGHILSLDRASSGDGIISALQVLEVMTVSGLSLAELRAPVTKFPQIMINVPVSAEGRGRLHESAPIDEALRNTENALHGRGRVILRASGTEPLVRVTLEGEDGALVEQLANDLADVVRTELQD